MRCANFCCCHLVAGPLPRPVGKTIICCCCHLVAGPLPRPVGKTIYYCCYCHLVAGPLPRPVGKTIYYCCCCHLVAGPLPRLWVRPYIIAAAATSWLAPYPNLWVRPYYAFLQFFPILSLDRTINCHCIVHYFSQINLTLQSYILTIGSLSLHLLLKIAASLRPN